MKHSAAPAIEPLPRFGLRLRKLVTAVAGLTAVAVVWASWPAMRAARKYYELRRRPSLLEAYLTSEDEESIEAARRFLATRPGKEELLRLYLLEFNRTVAGDIDFLRPLSRGAKDTAGGILYLWEGGGMMTVVSPAGGTRSASIGLQAESGERRRRILSHLDRLRGVTLECADFPGYLFRIEDLREPDPPAEWRSILPRTLPSASGTAALLARHGLRHACYFARKRSGP